MYWPYPLALLFIFLNPASAYPAFNIFNLDGQSTHYEKEFKLNLKQDNAAEQKRFLQFLTETLEQAYLPHEQAQQLKPRRQYSDKEGIVWRFEQYIQNNIKVEGGEVVAIFDNNGKLTKINNALIPFNQMQFNNILKQEEAQEKLTHVILKHYKKFDHRFFEFLSKDRKRPELIVSVDNFGQPELSWVFYSAVPGFKVYLYASGKRKGEFQKATSLYQSYKPSIDVYDGQFVIFPTSWSLGGKLINNNKKANAFWRPGFWIWTKVAQQLEKQFARTTNFFYEVFGRKSYDDKGAELKISMNLGRYRIYPVTYHLFRQNAAWVSAGNFFLFGAGGATLGNFSQSLDIVAHEYTHAVIDSTSELIYQGEAGALNEHFADVFGVLVEHYYNESPPHKFLIGEHSVKNPPAGVEALRDMVDPNRGLTPQPGHVSEIAAEYGPFCAPSFENDNCGVHILSGIPNRVAAHVISHLGIKKSAKLYYQVMTRINSAANFKNYSGQLQDECIRLYGYQECRPVREGLQLVGLY